MIFSVNIKNNNSDLIFLNFIESTLKIGEVTLPGMYFAGTEITKIFKLCIKLKLYFLFKNRDQTIPRVSCEKNINNIEINVIPICSVNESSKYSNSISLNTFKKKNIDNK